MAPVAVAADMALAVEPTFRVTARAVAMARAVDTVQAVDTVRRAEHPAEVLRGGMSALFVALVPEFMTIFTRK